MYIDDRAVGEEAVGESVREGKGSRARRAAAGKNLE